MKKGVIQWFVCLFKRAMNEYEANEKEKQKLYESIKKSRKQNEGGVPNELSRDASSP